MTPAMTREKFGNHVNRMHSEEVRLRQAGQQEYARSEDNAFANFIRVGESLGLSAEEVLMVYLLKHLDGISAWVKGHRSQRESVHGRIADARVYLALLDGMVKSYETEADFIDWLETTEFSVIGAPDGEFLAKIQAETAEDDE